MHVRIEQNNSDYIRELFVAEREREWTFNVNPVAPPISRQMQNVEEFESVIFSINPNGFGFILDEERNNIFFHYSRVGNCDFSELKSGMRVRYTVEEDAERTKRDGAPRFRATRVTVA
jgi:cold shock CspA family protein